MTQFLNVKLERLSKEIKHCTVVSWQYCGVNIFHFLLIAMKTFFLENNRKEKSRIKFFFGFERQSTLSIGFYKEIEDLYFSHFLSFILISLINRESTNDPKIRNCVRTCEIFEMIFIPKETKNAENNERE